MRNQLILATLAATLAIVSFTGCGGGSSSGGGPQPISVSLATAPPATMTLGATANVSATVLNDAAGAGVSWSCTPAASCGSFNPTSTASGATTVYTAPTTVPTGGSVTITAASVSNSSKTATASVTFPISIAFQTAPPASLQISGIANISVLVSNDTSNAGVAWSCTPANTCGTFTPTATTSGQLTMYSAPATIPSGGSVSITATSVADGTKSKSQTVTITAPLITILITTAPPAALQTGATANIAATTTNDPATNPVNWSCTPAGSCGSFSVSPTASGATTVYTAPAAPPPGGSVTITATSATDNTKSNSAVVLITMPAGLSTLKGSYLFFVQAPTGARGTTTFVGSIDLDGNGGVTGGTEDIVSTDYDQDFNDPILPTTGGVSLYTVDASGHGTLHFKTQTGETLDLSFVMTSATHGQIIETGGDPASGTFDLQTPPTGTTTFAASQISGTYSFTMDGVDSAVPAKDPMDTVAIGGVFHADGVSLINSGTLDINSGGAPTTSPQTGNFTAPDPATGRGTITLLPSGRIFVYYIISNRALRLFENDNIDLIGGSAFTQGTVATTLTGNFAYRHAGWTASGGRTVAAGQFAATAGGITGGISDANAGGGAAPSKGVAVSGTLAGASGSVNDAAGTSAFNVYPVDSTLNLLDPNNATGKGGALLLHTGANLIGTGMVVPQTATGAFTGNYAVNLQYCIPATTANELDLVGVFTADGTSKFTGGLADYDENNPNIPHPILGGPLTGTFTSDAANAGRFTGTMTVGPPLTAVNPYPFLPGSATTTSTFSVSIYEASGTEAFLVETDTQANSEGVLVQQQLP